MQNIPTVTDVSSPPVRSEEYLQWDNPADLAGKKQFAQTWLNRQASLIRGCVSGVLVLGEPDVGPFTPLAIWPAGGVASPSLADVADRSIQDKRTVVARVASGFVFSEPLILAGHLYGLVAIECHAESINPDEMANALRWGLSSVRAMLLSETLASTQVVQERMVTLLNLLGTSLNESDFNSAAHAVATELALQLGCDRVSIGFREKGFCTVRALSHSAQFGERMNLMQAIALAMDEALDQNQLINMPASLKEICVVRDHAALSRQYGSDAILTIPFLVDAKVQGAFVFERSGEHLFDARTIELCQGCVSLCSRILILRQQAEHSALTRLRSRIADKYRALQAAGNYVTKLALAAGTVFLLLIAVIPGPHRVSGAATIEGSVVRQLIAPFDGYLESTTLRAGDVVHANDVLAHLDERDLHLEYMRWSSQADQYEKQFEQFRAEHDRAQSEIAQAQSDQAQAQMALLAEQIQRSAIKAPFDGMVVSGDLSQMLGSTVKRGQVLFEVSPLHHFRVILEVDESDINGIVPGQSGQLVLASLPGTTLTIHVLRVTPLVVAKEGRSFYRVEASLDADAAQAGNVRPGMEGIAKVELGSRSLFWLWTHKMVDWLRLFIWNWL